MLERYHRANKQKILQIIDETMKRFGVKNYLIYGSFARRKYFRDIDIAIVDKISESRLERIADELEKRTGIEADVRRYEELPDAIKFTAFVKSIRRLERNKRRELMHFARVYMDTVEWLRKWL